MTELTTLAPARRQPVAWTHVANDTDKDKTSPVQVFGADTSRSRPPSMPSNRNA